MDILKMMYGELVLYDTPIGVVIGVVVEVNFDRHDAVGIRPIGMMEGAPPNMKVKNLILN